MHRNFRYSLTERIVTVNRNIEPRYKSERKDELSSKDKADLLMREYTLFKQEIHLLTGYYKTHVKYLQFLATGVIAIIGLSLTKEAAFLTDSRTFFIISMYSITTI